MNQHDLAQILAQLQAPFPPELHAFKPGRTTQDKSRGLAMAYVDPRHYQARLDAVDPAWRDALQLAADSTLDAAAHLNRWISEPTPALGRSFTLEAEYRRTYVRASLSVAEQCLRFYFQEAPDDVPQLIDTRPFELPESVQPYDPTLAEDLLP
jgi:hypothetical protein